jgi:hypothetical protein
MTPEDLRRIIVSGLDRALGSPLLLSILSEQQKMVLKAERAYWTGDSGTQLAKLLEISNSL